MDDKILMIIGFLFWGMYTGIHIILCIYAPAFAFGKKRWASIRPEYEKAYIKNEIQVDAVTSCFFFLVAFQLIFNMPLKYMLGIDIVLYIGLLAYTHKKKKMLPGNCDD